MFPAIGLVVLIAMVFGGFAITGGALGPVLHALPHEMLIIGGAAAGLGGVLASHYFGYVSPMLGGSLLIFAFIVTVIGGLGSLTGAAIAAVAVAVLQQFANFYLGGTGDFVVVLALALVQVDDYSPLILLLVWSTAMGLAYALASANVKLAGALVAAALACVGGVAFLHTMSNTLGYRFRARITKAGCKPKASRRCTRTSVWSS